MKALAVWCVILALAFANAGLREVVLAPRLGKVRSLTASGVLLSVLVLAVAYVSLPWIGAVRMREWLAVGLGWFALSLAFDLLLGIAQGERLRQQLGAYLFRRGSLWPIVLLVTASAPYLAARLRGWA
jgi:predicted small integral membrane protein